MSSPDREKGLKANEAYYKLKAGLVLYLEKLESIGEKESADKVNDFFNQSINNGPCNYKRALTRMADWIAETGQDPVKATENLVFSDDQHSPVKAEVLIDRLRKYLPQTD